MVRRVTPLRHRRVLRVVGTSASAPDPVSTVFLILTRIIRVHLAVIDTEIGRFPRTTGRR